jgi:hypothetical protein
VSWCQGEKQSNEIKSEKEMKGFERNLFEAKDKKVSCINQNVLATTVGKMTHSI